MQAGDAEEGHEDALRRRHVGVHEDADGLAGAHGGDETAGEVVLVQDAVAVEAADAVDHRVDERIVEAADDHAHGVAGERVVEAGELPGAEVAGEHEDSPAPVAGGEVVLEAFVADEAAGVVAGVAGHLAELGEKPAEVAVFGAKDVLALGGWARPGKASLEVAQADAAQAAERGIGECWRWHRPMARAKARGKEAEEVDEEPRHCELKSLAQAWGGALRGVLIAYAFKLASVPGSDRRTRVQAKSHTEDRRSAARKG